MEKDKAFKDIFIKEFTNKIQVIIQKEELKEKHYSALTERIDLLSKIPGLDVDLTELNIKKIDDLRKQYYTTDYESEEFEIYSKFEEMYLAQLEIDKIEEELQQTVQASIDKVRKFQETIQDTIKGHDEEKEKIRKEIKRLEELDKSSEEKGNLPNNEGIIDKLYYDMSCLELKTEDLQKRYDITEDFLSKYGSLEALREAIKNKELKQEENIKNNYLNDGDIKEYSYFDEWIIDEEQEKPIGESQTSENTTGIKLTDEKSTQTKPIGKKAKSEDTKDTLINAWLNELDRLDKEDEFPEAEDKVKKIMIDIYKSGMSKEFCEACNVSDDLKKMIEDANFSQIGTAEDKVAKFTEVIDKLVSAKEAIYFLIKAGLLKDAVEKILVQKEANKAGPAKINTAKVDPAKTNTGKADPAKTNTGKADPAKTNTGKVDPVKTNTGKVDPVKSNVVKTDPVKPNVGKADPAKTNTRKTDPAKAEPKYHIDFYAKEQKYKMVYQEGTKVINLEISLDEIISNDGYKDFLGKLQEKVNNFDSKGVDPYIAYVIRKTDNKVLFKEYVNSIISDKKVESINICYKMDGIYGRKYSKELSADIMNYANIHKEKGLATVEKGPFTRFMESYPKVRKIWETVSKVGGSKQILLPITKTKKEELDDDVIIEDDVIVINKKSKQNFVPIIDTSNNVKQAIEKADQILGDEIDEKDNETEMTAEEAMAKADKVLEDDGARG